MYKLLFFVSIFSTYVSVNYFQSDKKQELNPIIDILTKSTCQDSLKIEFRNDKKDFTNQISKIWGSPDAEIITEKVTLNNRTKNHIVINIEILDTLSKTSMDEKFVQTTSLLIDNVKNYQVFRVAKINYTFKNQMINKGGTHILYKLIDQVPIAFGCESSLNNAAQKRCFNSAVGKHISKNFKYKKFTKLGFKKGKHRIYTTFKVSKLGKIDSIIVEHNNSKIKEEVSKIFNGIKIKKPGYNDGKPVDVNYKIPLAFVIE